MSPLPSPLTISTPGRICLFGEHQDYLGLPVIPAAISRRITIRGSVRNDDGMHINLPDVSSKVSFALRDTFPYTGRRDYFRSCVNVLRKHGRRFSRGYDCMVRGNIPITAGTSSSSALVVSWIHFLSLIADDPVPLTREEMGKLAYEAEVLEFSEPGGMMDQYSTAIGGLIFLESHPTMKITPLRGRLGAFVLGNSHQQKDTHGILARVRGQATSAAEAARRTIPGFSFHSARKDDLRKLRGKVSSDELAILEATIINRDLTLEARELLLQENVDHKRIGTMLTEHQKHLRDTLRISTQRIDAMIDAALKAGALGAKINGSGGGGCMFAYAPDNADRVAEAVGALGEAMVVSIDEGTRREPADA